jgi:hypothetical protein
LLPFATAVTYGRREWAEWIREHAERTDPLNGPRRLE